MNVYIIFRPYVQITFIIKIMILTVLHICLLSRFILTYNCTLILIIAGVTLRFHKRWVCLWGVPRLGQLVREKLKQLKIWGDVWENMLLCLTAQIKWTSEVLVESIKVYLRCEPCYVSHNHYFTNTLISTNVAISNYILGNDLQLIALFDEMYL